ncbi:MAG: hypothetical protein IPP91_12215 [Betaproteobacteria bacterium]|nr:hypothetical protein [Betaproteobacteria bacterium]
MNCPAPHVARLALAVALALSAAPALAQSKAAPAKTPIANYWMDVATVNMSIPGMEEMADSPLIGGMMGNFFGGSKMGMMPGKWLDLALYTREKPAGTEATHAIPPGQRMGPGLPLQPVARPQPSGTSQGGVEEPERPKGRLLLYWGCSETVRPGQPRVLDMATAGPADFGKFFMGRYAPERGATSQPGRAIWPNEKDKQRVPKDSSLSGDHAVSGEGVPPSLKFAIGEKQDFMERLNLAAPGDAKASIPVSWNAVSTARAYFLSAMGGGGDDLILWSSSDVPEAGLGLMDYLANGQIDQWVKDKVLLPATTQKCAIPEGIFAKAAGAMVRAIAYGNELNLLHPPRPTAAKLLAAWNPEWSLRVRVKSTSMTMLGQEAAPERQPQQQRREKDETINPLDILKKGIFGR